MQVNKSGFTTAARSRVMIALFCCAMVLLTAFTVRWLQAEYASAESELNKDLLEAFISARDQVMDTVLTRSFIEPLLNNPEGFKISHVQNDTLAERDSVTVIARAVNSDTLIHITSLCDTCPSITEENFGLRDSNNELVRGVKLFITEVKGERGGREFFKQHVALEDTALLQSYYKHKIADKGLSVHIAWVSDTAGFNFPPPLFQYDSHMFDMPYQAEVSGYKKVILKGMVPQFLFAGLLITVILIAFIFAYRSLRKQWLLAQLKDDLISNISHELKTPVATMKVAIEAMQEMDPAEKKEKIRAYLHMAGEEVARLDTLVNKVMQSVLGDGVHDFFHATLIDVTALVHSMQDSYQGKDVKFQIQVPEEPCYIMGDAFHVRSAIQNLLENAAKYGGTQVSLQVGLQANMVSIHVIDNGPGIPTAYQEKIFEKFFRIPTGNIHHVKGYGLGLHYVKQVTESTGGTISVRNNADAGCTFTILIPRADGLH
jgi:signal transduction histidine kinase